MRSEETIPVLFVIRQRSLRMPQQKSIRTPKDQHECLPEWSDRDEWNWRRGQKEGRDAVDQPGLTFLPCYAATPSNSERA
jgi:hypothetical protein